VPKLSATPGHINWAGPRLGEHNTEIYEKLLDLTQAEIAELVAAQVI
jgi:crotonobetainyl-CoA:carnitine CoA-transferase CaiB-like acyl-CoA transferase